MNCCYCGKRVSLVRKRVDADFCCDEHREKYHARTRRSIETLRQADEQNVIKRRLNEGLPERPPGAHKGADLDLLLLRSPAGAEPFAASACGLPASRPNLEIYVPGAGRAPSAGPRVRALAAARLESVRWNLDAVQQGVRPPRPFSIAIRLPQGGPRRIGIRQAACDRPRKLRTAEGAELSALAGGIVRKLGRRGPVNVMREMMRSVHPPAPVKPPRARPPIVVTLRHPVMAVHLGKPQQPPRVSVRMPHPGMTGLSFAPPQTQMRPPAAAYVAIVRRQLSIPGIWIAPAGMPGGGEPRGAQRSTPCPEGFRRRQYYSSEPLERFCGLGFETIAAHRPAIRIVGAPAPAAQVPAAGAWAAPAQDPTCAEPERRRPAPPFRERVTPPRAVQAAAGPQLPSATPGRLPVPSIDSRYRFPAVRSWDAFPGEMLVRPQAGPGGVRPAEWPAGAAEALGVAAWGKPHNRGARRTSIDLPIGAPPPVFTGPVFAAGRRRAGPALEKRSAPPVFPPAEPRVRPQTVDSSRPPLLPVSETRLRGLGDMPILAGVCQPPVGHVPVISVMHPACKILLATALPAGHLTASAVAGLATPAAVHGSASPFDMPKGMPQLAARLALERFRRRAGEGLRSRQAAPEWPARSTPPLLAPAAPRPCPHAAHELEREPAAAMFRAAAASAPGRFRGACALMHWGAQTEKLPGSADCGRAPHCVSIDLPLPFVLPVDSLGPIRDWGLAPPPEPEKPPEPVHEDFAAGLANWICSNADWRQDIAGVRTGSLALLRPSLNMLDYELEFLGKIENQSIGWAFRASNAGNYQAVRIVLDGAEGKARLVRFTVLAGEREPAEAAPLDAVVGQNASCRVKMSVRGNEFRLFINDKPVFEWEDDRLPEGGVGFFSEGDDRARLYWVKVTPLPDALSEELYQPAGAALRPEIHRQIRMGV